MIERTHNLLEPLPDESLIKLRQHVARQANTVHILVHPLYAPYWINQHFPDEKKGFITQLMKRPKADAEEIKALVGEYNWGLLDNEFGKSRVPEAPDDMAATNRKLTAYWTILAQRYFARLLCWLPTAPHDVIVLVEETKSLQRTMKVIQRRFSGQVLFYRTEADSAIPYRSSLQPIVQNFAALNIRHVLVGGQMGVNPLNVIDSSARLKNSIFTQGLTEPLNSEDLRILADTFGGRCVTQFLCYLFDTLKEEVASSRLPENPVKTVTASSFLFPYEDTEGLKVK